MKRIITAFVFTGILISCNSSDKTKNAIQESSVTETLTDSTSNDVKIQLNAIDTDEALIATALMAAVVEGHDHIIQELLEPTVYYEAYPRESPFGSFPPPSPQLVRVYLPGANPDIKDAYGYTPLSIALREVEAALNYSGANTVLPKLKYIVRLLIRYGADPYITVPIDSEDPTGEYYVPGCEE